MKRHSYKWAFAAIGLVALIFVMDRAEDWLTHIEYPLNIWRMDLDDLMFNLGTFLLGFAAFLTVFKRNRATDRRVTQVSERINGGMADLAKEHVKIATQEATEAGHFVDLLGRVTVIEKQRDDCHESLEDMKVEMGKIQEWVVARLDDTGNGRNEER